MYRVYVYVFIEAHFNHLIFKQIYKKYLKELIDSGRAYVSKELEEDKKEVAAQKFSKKEIMQLYVMLFKLERKIK